MNTKATTLSAEALKERLYRRTHQMAEELMARLFVNPDKNSMEYLYSPDKFRELFLCEAGICADYLLSDLSAMSGRAALASRFNKKAEEAKAQTPSEADKQG